MVTNKKKLNHESVLCENGFNALVINVTKVMAGITVEKFIDLNDKRFYQAIIMDDEILTVDRVYNDN